jgi:hypothetical protein
MKKMIFVLTFMMTASICVEAHNNYSNHGTISVRIFYDELLPYGEWINTPEFGYAWRPYLDDQDDFKPYSSGGHWVYTDLGWTWISDYRWGWAAFHYGRWYFDDFLGWMWVPGNEWAPAWVMWGSYNDYWTWAPMGPKNQVNFNFCWQPPAFWWTFVPYRHFCSYNWHSYIYNPPVQITSITYITNIYNGDNYRHNDGKWFHGPRVSDVERHLKTRIRKMKLIDTDKPDNLFVRNDRVNVYRPGVVNERENIRPGRYRNAADVRTDRENLRTTKFKTERSPKTSGKTMKADQGERERNSSAINNQPTKRNSSTARSKKNTFVNSRVDQPTNETRSGSMKVNRGEFSREPVKHNTSRERTGNQIANERNQKTVPSKGVTSASRSQTSGLDRGTGK